LWQFFPSVSPVEGAQTKSLYDLLGARENDDAEALKKAFRKAIKANHPDLHPCDPDAVERFREIIAAYARLRDAKDRATYDWLLQLERQRFQVKPMFERQQRQSTLASQQLRLKRTRATAAVAVVGALIIGYGLFAPMLTTTTSLEISEDEHVATTGAVVENNRQTATVVVAAGENENPPIAIAAVAESRAAVSAPPAPTSTVPASDRDEVAALFARGRATLSNGDVAAARVLLRRAAEQGDPQAAVALGETYDPAVLKRFGVIKFNPDLAQAREWYRRAADLGPAAAAMRSDQLSEICKYDEDKLRRLRASLERDEVVRFEYELGCERLRPQVVRLRESISAEGERGDRGARQQSQAEQRRPTADAEMQKPEREAAVRSAPSPMPREQICKHDEERLMRVRASLERDEVLRLEYELNCERLRPQVVRLRESLGAN
jgi:TPR repeat protein